MSKRLCSDCVDQRNHCRSAIQRLDGSVYWVCRQCWIALDYAAYMPLMSTGTELSAFQRRADADLDLH